MNPKEPTGYDIGRQDPTDPIDFGHAALFPLIPQYDYTKREIAAPTEYSEEFSTAEYQDIVEPVLLPLSHKSPEEVYLKRIDTIIESHNLEPKVERNIEQHTLRFDPTTPVKIND